MLADRPRASTAALAALRWGALLAVLQAVLLTACGTPSRQTNAPQAALQAAQQAGGKALARGDHAAALAAYQRALAAAESVEDFEGIATARLNLALVWSRLARPDQAQAQLDPLLAAPQRYPTPLLQQAAARKALAAFDDGRAADALAWADRAQAGCAAPCAVAAAMDNLRAAAALQKGDAANAVALAMRAATLAVAIESRAEQANALRLQGRAWTLSGDTASAAAALAQALEIDRALGLPERIALDLMHAAENETRRNQPDAARSFYERALQVSRAAGLTAMAEHVAAQLAAPAAR